MRCDPFLEYLKSIEGKRITFVSNPGNAGDGFIAYATYYLFEKYNIDAKIVRARSSSGIDANHNEVVAIGGGGNLIDGLYRDLSDFILSHGDDAQKCIVFPHTVRGYKQILDKTHKNLELYLREKSSYEAALANGANPENTHLAHDVTFYLDDDHFKGFFSAGRGEACLFRTDRESRGLSKLYGRNVDISRSWSGDLWHNKKLAWHTTASLASYISEFSLIRTDRLHIAILSAFLRKDVIFHGNSYYKNRAVFEHSIAGRFLKVKFIREAPERRRLNKMARLLWPRHFG